MLGLVYGNAAGTIIEHPCIIRQAKSGFSGLHFSTLVDYLSYQTLLLSQVSETQYT